MILNSNDIHEVLKLSKADYISFIGDGETTKIVAHDMKDVKFKGQIVKKIYNGGIGKTIIDRNVLKLIPKNCKVELYEDSIIAGKRIIKYKLNDLVNEPIQIDNYLTTIDGKELEHLLSGYYAIATDTIRPTLSGICINESDFVALDGYRLTVRTGNFEAKEQVVMDINLVNTLKKIKYDCEVKVYYNDKFVKFVFDDLEVIGNRINGEFIKYETIIPSEYTTSAKVETKPILNILKNYKKNKFNLVKLNFTEDDLILSAENEIASVEDKTCIKLQGKLLKIAFNPNYLIDALKDYEVATLELTNNISPLVIKGDNKLDLILPVRIREDY